MTPRRLILERCDWCGDHFDPGCMDDVKLTDRTIRACDECRQSPALTVKLGP